MTCGIYKIALADGRCYVGQSIDIKRRWKHHRTALRQDRHDSPYFQNAWNKYGENAFAFEVIEECEADSLTEREQFWMDELDSAFCFMPAAPQQRGDERRRQLTNDLNRLSLCRPDIAAQWHPTKNSLSPDQVSLNSSYRAWWVCNHCNHEWQTRVANRVACSSGCPLCALATVGTKLSWQVGATSLADANPDLANEWHPFKNGSKTPDRTMLASGFRAWWLCSECSHEWQTSVTNRTYHNSKCPSCAGRIATDNNRLSIQRPLLVQEWGPSNDRSPAEVTPFSHYRALWICNQCGHHWTATVAQRSNGTGCPVCGLKLRGRRRAIVA